MKSIGIILWSFLVWIISSTSLYGQNMLANPESVVFDSVHNRYLVSNNLTGRIIQIDQSGNQSIFKSTLAGCLGMQLIGDIVYVSCRSHVKGVNINTGETIADITISGTQQLDGMATDNYGYLYVVESIQGKIFKIHISTKTYITFVNNTLFANPQDLAFDQRNNRLLLCSYASNSPIQAIDIDNGKIVNAVETKLGVFDGIDIDAEGNVYVATHSNGGIYRYDNNFLYPPTIISLGHDGPAGLSVNDPGKILAVPNFNDNTISFISLGEQLPPLQFTAYSDFNTPHSVRLDWENPDLQSDFAIMVFRDTKRRATLDSGIPTYTDSGLVNHALYTYYTQIKVGDYRSILNSVNVYAGGSAIAKVPALFTVVDGGEGVTLTWINPCQQLDGTPLNDLASIQIFRDGILLDGMNQTSADTAQSRSYFDTTNGYHIYKVRICDNETPNNYSSFSDSLLGSGNLGTSYLEDFEEGKGSIYQKGSWDTTGQFAYSNSHSITDSPVGDYSNNSEVYFLLPPVILGDQPVLKFRDIAVVRPGDSVLVQISTDVRKSFSTLRSYDWTAQQTWQDGTADPGDWIEEIIDLSDYMGDTATIRFCLNASPELASDGWYIDSIAISSGSPIMNHMYNVQKEWNMLSLPVRVSDRNADIVFPSAVSYLFTFKGSYVPQDLLEQGSGYWIKFDSSFKVEISGGMITKDTVDVVAGWNIIGSISYELDTVQITSIPENIVKSSYYTYEGGYIPSQMIRVGGAYWVKASQDGKLILSMFQNSSRNDKTSIDDNINQEMSWLEFTDSHGYKRALYFIDKLPSEMSLDFYDLPPTPPEGAFDVRFASQRTTEAADPNRNSFPIRIQSVHYPLIVTWKLEQSSINRWSLACGSSSVDLEGNGKLILHQDESLVLMTDKVEGNLIPTEFKLEENYPNPFNPSTTIRYQLPQNQFVELIVYDILGREVAVLVNGNQTAGYYTFEYPAQNSPGGIYFYRLSAGKYSETRKMILIR